MRFLLALTATFAWCGQALAQDTWRYRASTPEPIYLQGGGVVDGKIYMFGGASPVSGAPYSKTWEYDPATDLWTEKAPMPTPVAAMASVTLGGVIYCIGGAEPSATLPSAAVLAYDPSTNTWSSKAAMPTARYLCVGEAAAGKIYVCGGEIVLTSGPFAGLVDYTDVVEEYDPLTDRWTSKASMPIAVSNAFHGAMGGKVYVVGGFSGIPGASVLPGNEFSNVSRSTLEYDPATDEWTLKSPMPDDALYGIYAGESAVIGDKLFCFGGDYVFAGPLPVTYEYTAASDSWTTLATAPSWQAWSWAAAAGGKAYVLGNTYGGAGTADTHMENLEYTPLTSPYVAPTLSDLAQRDVAGGAVPSGAQAPAVIRFQALIADPDSSVRLEVEIRPASDPYNDVPTVRGDFVAAGLAFAEFPTDALAPGDYKWRARAVDETGQPSEWTNFGTTNPDFVVVAAAPPPAPPSGGSSKKGGCSSSVPGGAAALAPALLLAALACLTLRR